MSEESVPAQLPDDGKERIDWLAALLELIPLSAIALFFAFEDAASSGSTWLLAIPLILSGIGWFKIGRFGTGCALVFGRVVALSVLLYVAVAAAFASLYCDWPEPDNCDAATVGWVSDLSFLALLAIAFLIPVASAIMVARASRIR